MKKIITCMILGLLSLVSCTEYDEVAMWNKNEDMGSRLAALEELCSQMNTNITSLQLIIEALQENDYVTGVVPVVENGETIGYTITFVKSGPVTIYHGEDGRHGTMPVIGVKQDSDGIYYWTLDGEWLTDDDGERVMAQGMAGITPKLEIRDDGYWYISYDGEHTWTKLGQATGDSGLNGDSMFSDIDNSDPDYLVLTLAESSQQIKLPYYKDKFDLLFVSGTDKVKEMTVYCGAGASVEVSYELTNPLDEQIAVECISHSGYKITVDKTAGKIYISAPDDPAAVNDPETILVFASDEERTILRKLVVKQVKYIEYKATGPLSWDDSLGQPRFWGEDCVFIDEQSSYDPDTGEGKWAYIGTVVYIVDCAFIDETSLQGITIPASVTEVGRNLLNETGGGSAFQGCTALNSVVFEGDNMTQININTFNGCKALSSIDLPESVKLIDYNAFLRCSALKEITIPDAVVKIDRQVFSQCSSLKKVTLGTQLETIGMNAFNECLALETVLCSNKTPAQLGTGAFPLTDGWGYEAKYKIYVPDDVVDVYRAAWPKYWDDSNPWKTTKVIYGMSSMPAE